MNPKIIFLTSALAIIGISSCSPKVSTSGGQATQLFDEFEPQIILYLNDSLPDNIIKKGTIKISDKGFSVNCDFPDIMMLAKAEARKMGGNIIKITEHKLPSPVTSSCHRIKADIFYLQNITPYEKEIIWSPRRKLNWSDFKGTPQAFPAAEAVTASKYEIFSIVKLEKGKRMVQTRVFAKFICQSSWVRPESASPEILAHEQGHFDITEIFARKLQKELNELQLNVNEYNNQAQSILNKIAKEEEAFQNQYDNETILSIGLKKQQDWLSKIEQELKSLPR